MMKHHQFVLIDDISKTFEKMVVDSGKTKQRFLEDMIKDLIKE